MPLATPPVISAINRFYAARAIIVLIALGFAAVAVRAADSPLIVAGPEQQSIDLTKPYGNLQPLPGVANNQVFRASRADPDDTDGKGWTYHHHVDLGVWRGKLYCAWDSCEKDEDVWPSRELYATSDDGFTWSKPVELFPMGLSTGLRMYFFRATNDRMLAIAGFRGGKDPLSERAKGSLVVREINPDHTLGEVFMLRPTTDLTKQPIPLAFESSTDAAFVNACRQLLANKPFLEQQDYGNLLGDAKMKWHDVNAWPADEPSRAEFNRFGKALAFYHRKDGALVGTMKWGWVLVSHDEGETWSSPVRPPTFVSGMAKAWGQRTSDGRYALFYNPSLTERYPLVQVTGDDGITFGNMRVIHGEAPPMRYEGLYKAAGPQYVRGVSEWSSDGSFKDSATWVAYSVNKEDIWVSRVPVATATTQPAAPGDLRACLNRGWIICSPRWAQATAELDTDGTPYVRFADRDPLDHGQVMIPTIDGAPTRFRLRADTDRDQTIDLLDRPAVPAGHVVLSLRANVWAEVQIKLDDDAKHFSVMLDGREIVTNVVYATDAMRVRFVCIATGDRVDSIAATDDLPSKPTTLDIR